jgi:hypothetical protein
MSTSQKESAIDENVHFARIADRRQFPRSTHASAMIKKLTLHGSIATTSIAFATVRDGELHYEGFSTSRRVLGFKAESNDHFLVIIRLAQKNQKRCSACLKSIHEVTGAITITYQQRRASRLSIISARYYWRKYGRDLSRSADYNNKRNAFYRLSFKQARWVAGFDLGSVEFTTFKKRILRTFIKTPPSGLNANLTKGCSLQDSGMEYYWRASSRQLDAIIQSTSRLRATASTTTATTTTTTAI